MRQFQPTQASASRTTRNATKNNQRAPLCVTPPRSANKPRQSPRRRDQTARYEVVNKLPPGATVWQLLVRKIVACSTIEAGLGDPARRGEAGSPLHRKQGHR